MSATPKLCKAALRHLLLLLSVLLVSCQHQSAPVTSTTENKTAALIKKTGEYAWRVQLTVEYPDQQGTRTLWFTTPSSGILPLEDCTEVSAASLYANGGRWLQPGGPKWHGYLIFYPNDSPPRLEIQCIERSSCSCRHFETSRFSGRHSVSKVGVWKPFPKG